MTAARLSPQFHPPTTDPTNQARKQHLTEEVITVTVDYGSPASLASAGADPLEDLLPCRRQDPELWFAESPTDLELAKSYCADCPLRDACLAGALERREPWGVWGGQIFERGVVVARKRPRGRPRKSEVAA